MAASAGDGDGTGARHGDDALVLNTFRVVKLFAVDTPLALRDERVDRLMAVHAFVGLRKPGAFAKPKKTNYVLFNLYNIRSQNWRYL